VWFWAQWASDWDVSPCGQACQSAGAGDLTI
jgi:hypothetical protein